MSPRRPRMVRSPRLRQPAILSLLAMAALALAGAVARTPDEIESDETVLTIPTDARLSDDGSEWLVPIHAWVFEEEAGSAVRGALIDAFARSLDLSDEQARDGTFRARARLFLVDGERGKRLAVRWAEGGETHPLARTEENGRSRSELRVPIGASDRTGASVKMGGWITATVVPASGGAPEVATPVRLVPADGVSVISDIDDTIKVSNVRDRKALLVNTFVAPYRAVEGMVAVYRGWADEGATVHFVTATPWQLHGPLTEWLAAEGFPRGTLRMKSFRWKDDTLANLWSAPERTKAPQVEELLRSYPRRRFVLVGDSGESDPEMYAGFARRHPEQVAAILIRNVTDEGPDAPRWQGTFAGVPRSVWRVFDEASELPALAQLVRREGNPPARRPNGSQPIAPSGGSTTDETGHDAATGT